MQEYLISIIIPVFEEEKQIDKSLHTIHSILLENEINHELIIIDDGSGDNTWDVLKRVSSELTVIRAVRLSRNFGKEAALYAGIELAKGDACIIMDSDLQHPPDIIPEMVRLWREEGYEVVEGTKASRGKENLANSIGAKLFYSSLRKLSGINLDGASDFKLLDSKVIEVLREMNERNTFFRGMSVWVGFKRINIPFNVSARSGGNTKWSFIKLLKLAITAITSFTSLPLHLVTFMGVIFLAGSFLLGLQTLYMKFSGIAVNGFTTVILLLLIIGSTLMISLGIIGTYIAKIYDEVKYRPRYVIREEIKR